MVAGNPEASRLIRAIGYQDNELQMPPDSKLPDEAISVLVRVGSHGSLLAGGGDRDRSGGDGRRCQPAEQIETLRQTHWAYQPIVAIAPPAMEQMAPGVSAAKVNEANGGDIEAIDRFVLARLSEAGLGTQSTR